MNHYRVIASNADSALVALVDDRGRIHLGYSAAPDLVPGVELLGEAPAVGVRALHLPEVGIGLPVAFVLLDCDLFAVKRLLAVARETAAMDEGDDDTRTPREPDSGLQ